MLKDDHSIVTICILGHRIEATYSWWSFSHNGFSLGSFFVSNGENVVDGDLMFFFFGLNVCHTVVPICTNS